MANYAYKESKVTIKKLIGMYDAEKHVIDVDGENKDIIEELNDFVETVPLGRMGTAEEVAHTIFFLASDEAPYICGQNIQIDGCRRII